MNVRAPSSVIREAETNWKCHYLVSRPHTATVLYSYTDGNKSSRSLNLHNRVTFNHVKALLGPSSWLWNIREPSFSALLCCRREQDAITDNRSDTAASVGILSRVWSRRCRLSASEAKTRQKFNEYATHLRCPPAAPPAASLFRAKIPVVQSSRRFCYKDKKT